MADLFNIAGRINSTSEEGVAAVASQILDENTDKKQSEINEETATTLASHDSTITGLNSQNYVSVTASAGTTAVTDVLPATGAVNTVYRVGKWDGTQYDVTVYSEYSWSNNAYVLLDVKSYGIDEEPTPGSENVVKSGGIAASIVFDVTAANSGATFADLNALLTDANLNTLIPVSVRKGGMSIKFVLTNDNKYVQFRYMESDATTDVTFTNTANWQGVDDVPTAGSMNLVESGGVKREINNDVPYIIISEDTQAITYHPINIKQGHTYRLQKTENFTANAASVYFRIEQSTTGQSSVRITAESEYVDFVADKDYNLVMFFNPTPTVGGTEEIYLYDLNELLLQIINGKSKFSTNEELNNVGIDTNVTAESCNLVKSKGIAAAINPVNREVLGNYTLNIDWAPGLIQRGTGKIVSSASSYFSQPFILKKGDTVTVGTNSAYTGIICTTDANSLAVGDTVTVLQMTSEVSQFETYSYTAEEDIKIVLCVNISEYTLSLFNNNNIKDYIANTDTTPTANSNNLVKSGGVHAELYKTVYEELTIYSTLLGKYISNIYGELSENPYYSIQLIDISSYRGKSIRIDGICNNLTSAFPSFGFYSSTELSRNTLVQLSTTDQEVRDSFSDVVIVPQIASYLALVQLQTSTKSFTSRGYYPEQVSRLDELDYEVSEISDKLSGVEYIKTGQMISFGHLYKDRKIGYKVGPGGANTLVDFRSVYTYSAASGIDSPQDITSIIPSVGDMHGPFRFRSDNLTDVAVFTGGNHAYEGIKTAVLDYVRFYADGKEITAVNESGNCSKLEIVWSNLVKPGNAYAASDDYALRENHHMTYDGYTFDDWTELVPIVNIRMGLYYGLQLIPISGQTYVKYANAVNRLQNPSSDNCFSGDKTCSCIIAGKDSYHLSMYIDNTFDLGKRDLSDATDTGALHYGDTGKSYFTIIRSLDYSVVMNEATHYWLHGGYDFQCY